MRSARCSRRQPPRRRRPPALARSDHGLYVAYAPRAKEQERDAKSTEANHLQHRHHGFANGVAIFQVAIALGAVAALTRNRLIWFGSLLLGMIGAAFFGVTLLR